MYNPAHFREERLEVLQQLISRHRLATLVTLGSDGLIANHIPLIHDPDPAPLGVLRGHVARPNPQWRDSNPVVEALAIFQGPDAYISPSWYPTKSESDRVVPTWNYAVVHAHGPLQTFDDPIWLERHVRELVNLQEAAFPEPWKVDDAPADYIQGLLKGIVGVEMQITRLEGKWKMSQNRPARDQAGVVQALRSAGDPVSLAVADLVAERQSE